MTLTNIANSHVLVSALTMLGVCLLGGTKASALQRAIEIDRQVSSDEYKDMRKLGLPLLSGVSFSNVRQWKTNDYEERGLGLSLQIIRIEKEGMCVGKSCPTYVHVSTSDGCAASLLLLAAPTFVAPDTFGYEFRFPEFFRNGGLATMFFYPSEDAKSSEFAFGRCFVFPVVLDK